MRQLAWWTPGTPRRTSEAWAALETEVAERRAEKARMQERLAKAEGELTRIIAERDALVIRIADLEQRLHRDATVTQELPMPSMAKVAPIKVSAARFQVADFMQGAHAARGAA